MSEEPTPVFAQYLRIKESCKDSLLLFRMGDFYEMFFDDAKIAAPILDIVLTARGKSGGQPIPMAGVPVNSAQVYIDRLVREGHRVAVCEQVDGPATPPARGKRPLVKREVVRIFTPGTVTEDGLLDPAAASVVLAFALDARALAAGIATADISTGHSEIFACDPAALPEQICARSPREIVLPQSALEREGPLADFLRGSTIPLAPVADISISPDAGERRLRDVFGLASLDGLGAFSPAELTAAGALYDYLLAAQAGAPLRLDLPLRPAPGTAMAIDPITRAGLQLAPTPGTPRTDTLLGAIDRTRTSAGSRLLAARLAQPLTDPDAIAMRLDAVSYLNERDDVRERVRNALKSVPDLGRARARLGLDRGGPRDLLAIAQAVRAGECAGAVLHSDTGPLPDELAGTAATLDMSRNPVLTELIAALDRSLVPDPSGRRLEGDIIAAGVDRVLDEARSLRDDSRRVIASLQARYSQSAAISSLKIKHNNILGYFIETSVKFAERLARPPLNETFEHRQSLASAVRFTTVELRDLESKIARADDEVRARQAAILHDLVARAIALSDTLSAVADALAVLDVAASMAEWADQTGACRPVVDTSGAFMVAGGCHPVVQAAMSRRGETFVPNDCRLDADSADTPRLLLITGPNMAGKSTYLRQNALLAILAQAGSFVPARTMHLGVVDRVFSRVGAGDELARGRSTFMVEMIETAAILNQATERSVVILDEVGRGTSTHDGLAIAWACVEHLHEVNGCRALFATHYRELTDLAASLSHADNASLRAREWHKDLIFLHEVVPGPADKSYGIQVARLAGVPRAAIARAEEILARLETQSGSQTATTDLPLFSAAPEPEPDNRPDELAAAIDNIDPDSLSARDALALIYELKARRDS